MNAREFRERFRAYGEWIPPELVQLADLAGWRFVQAAEEMTFGGDDAVIMIPPRGGLSCAE